jgi:signal transduction histidine kinase
VTLLSIHSIMAIAPDLFALYLDQKAATRQTRMLATCFSVLAILIFLAVAPFVTVPLVAIPAFIPAYESALAIIEILTAVLLLGQYLRGAADRLLILASGFLFNAGIIVVHAMSFPGAFGPSGIIGGGPQTTAWLYTFWHLGFPLFVITYALHSKAPLNLSDRQRYVRAAIATVLVLLGVALIGAFCTLGHASLPTVVVGRNYGLMVTLGISPGMIVLCLLAIAVLVWGPGRNRSVLDVWLVAVMLVWLLDIAMSAVIGSARYDLGWYLGRVFGLGAGVFIFGVLLLEANALHAHLARALLAAEESKRQAVESREELARGQRLEAMGQLTGGIAHDFNNVLQVIGASLNLLRMKLSKTDKEQLGELIDRASAGVQRGARLSSELLAFGRRQPLRPRVIDAGELVVDMAEVARRTLGRAITIDTEVASDLWPTLVDPSLLENALLNLILNARDAIAENGNIVLSAQNVREGFFDFSQFADVPPGEYVQLTVRDNGAGIPAEVLPRVLEPFFTTKPLSQGTGLGLSMVHGFAKQSEGHLGIQSAVGDGTAVSLFLPRSREIIDRKVSVAALEIVGGEEVVLVVEDHPDVRHVAVNILETLGYRVLAAHDAESALEILESGQHIDVLFSDVIMPGKIRTADMATRARAILPNIIVLFTSGYIENVIGRAGIVDDGVHLLSKPYSSDDLARKLRELISARASMSA